MKVLFVCDYFPPFVKGGGEISSFLQAKKLMKKKIGIIILAPEYKEKIKKRKNNLKVYWYKFPFRTKNTSPIMFLNPIFLIYLFFQIIKVVKKERIDLIHCQGKYSMPSAALAKTFLRIPLILTLRDYKGICNHGFCLYQSKKGCNLFSFFKKDFLFYYQNYIKKKNIFSFLLEMIASYVGRINTLILAFFMKKADRLVCVSNFVGKVYAANGYDKKKMVTVYNPSLPVKTEDVKIPLKIKQKINRFKYLVLYAGKLSLGKGSDLLISSAIQMMKKRKDVLFLLAGTKHYPIEKTQSEQILFLDKVRHDLLLKIMNLVDLVCIPSVWPEPLSRVTLEAFSLRKPVLSSNVGGQKELVSEKTGWLFNPNKKELIKAINEAIRDKEKWHILGKNGQQLLLNLEKDQINRLVSSYKSIINK